LNNFQKKIYELKNNHSSVKKKTIELIPAEISKENIKLISKWRKENWEGFLTKFTVTETCTKLWLENIWKDSERILFIILENKKKIGHIGIYNYDKKCKSVDIDSVLKGIKNSRKDSMKKVLGILFDWVFGELNLKQIQLEVFSDNFKAINLYERAGMITKCSIPIKKVKMKNGWAWKKTKLTQSKIGERYLNQMEITKNDYLEHRKRVEK